jgi:hypothetical protein
MSREKMTMFMIATFICLYAGIHTEVLLLSALGLICLGVNILSNIFIKS